MASTMARLWRSLFGKAAMSPRGPAPAEPPRQPPEAMAGHRLEGLDWFKRPGASEAAIAHLKSVAPVALPESYIALLRYSNGGEGPLPVDPFTFCLESAEQVVEGHLDGYTREFFPELFFIAGTGGCERIAFDLRGPEPYPLVSLDMCGGSLEDIEPIALSFDAALELIGQESEEMIAWRDERES